MRTTNESEPTETIKIEAPTAKALEKILINQLEETARQEIKKDPDREEEIMKIVEEKRIAIASFASVMKITTGLRVTMLTEEYAQRLKDADYDEEKIEDVLLQEYADNIPDDHQVDIEPHSNKSETK